MTSPFNQAAGNAKVGWQSQYTHVDAITLPGDVQLADGRKWLQEHDWATAWTGDKAPSGRDAR